VSLNVADDDELLGLLRGARFEWVFIGIESPDEKSLKETGKTQNTGRDLLASVRKIYSYGIDVLGGFIIGFDNDTVDTFDAQYRFIVTRGSCPPWWGSSWPWRERLFTIGEKRRPSETRGSRMDNSSSPRTSSRKG